MMMMLIQALCTRWGVLFLKISHIYPYFALLVDLILFFAIFKCFILLFYSENGLRWASGVMLRRAVSSASCFASFFTKIFSIFGQIFALIVAYLWFCGEKSSFCLFSGSSAVIFCVVFAAAVL